MVDCSTVAKSYAEALFLVSKDDSSLDLNSWIDFLEEIVSLMSEDCFIQLMMNPGLEIVVKVNLLFEFLSLDINSKKYNFMLLLLEKNRFSLLPLILDSLKEIKNKKDGFSIAKVFTAFPIPDDLANRMLIIIENKFKLKLKMQILIDKSLIGGVVIIVGDKVLDMSMKNRLKKMQEALLTI
ncbi:F-type H+-transporting ATPase subunit delta [Candidatus Kinetoplastibacterium desouzaii TCC079E]|uniref:ATP synthase subunit delta n=1 Tax=Candidatus Kinetoplastidibacterium desouzai TCC079E TaxID=1208919 RepID=M1L1G1_9PROT|nr:F0F1 ATP synthase subunit delta [Candidatus Kinetoplastibacterium desouzaii]AGF46613.1 F-type H+-transporting ATPase subunit delta [Candidatus Kinetoplastibacterium desouzaii TCC079E]